MSIKWLLRPQVLIPFALVDAAIVALAVARL